MAGGRHAVGTALVAVAGLVGTSIVFQQVQTSVSSFNAELRFAEEVRAALKDDLTEASATLTDTLIVINMGLTPGAQLVGRCDVGDLPTKALDDPATCIEAELSEIREEQEVYLSLRKAASDAQRLERRALDHLMIRRLLPRSAGCSTGMRSCSC